MAQIVLEPESTQNCIIYFTHLIMRHTLPLLLLTSSTVCITCAQSQHPDENSIYGRFAPDGVPFTIKENGWNPDAQGNHRVVIKVNNASDAVQAKLVWRRPDLNPESKRLVIKHAPSGKFVKNYFLESIDSESGHVVFEPESGAGEYYVYYLPYKFRPKWDDARYSVWNDYYPAEMTADEAWMSKAKSNLKQLPKAKVLRYESRSRFDAFTPMGLIATKAEQEKILKDHPENPIIFTEDRAFPTRLFDRLPAFWAKNGKYDSFKGGANRNEYYVWQIVPWAAREALENLKLEFSSLSDGKTTIPAKDLTCFNLEGINWNGEKMTFDVNVPKGKLQPLWCGVQIPKNATPGVYTGKVTFSAKGVAPRTIPISIEVNEKVLADQGDGETWRHSRLRWLNSTIGMDDKPSGNYKAIKHQGAIFEATGKKIDLGKNGLPQTITINKKEVFSSPVNFVVDTGKGTLNFDAKNFKVTKNTEGKVSWTSSSTQEGIHFTCNASLEYDGYMRYNMILSADKDIQVNNVKLVTDYSDYASKYFMGIGHSGGARPSTWDWKWNGPYDSFWMGNAKAGMHTEFRGGAYHGPLLSDYKPAPPKSWSNGGAGGVAVSSPDASKPDQAQVTAYTGPMTISSKPVDFEWSFLITPVKPVDTAGHFTQRYFHADSPQFDGAAKEGANIANIHHARSLNPVINYPFIVRKPLIDFINKQHKQNRKVKLYYTVREVSNYVSEIYALKSLGHEIFKSGPGHGTPWHMEHLISDYQPAWYTELPDHHADAALVLSGFSRWINYYLEGLRWMYENYKLDGIYMDDVSFDRNVLKRISKINDQYRPGALIDLHSNTNYSKGPANQYTDFFPYIQRLWFGEHFWYDKMNPDEWFVTFSGIPFGMTSEMLQGGGNRWLGMVYGTTSRHSYQPDPNPVFNPAPVWALWDSFGIKDAKMLGYWDENVPVSTDKDMVKATAYVKKGKTLISVGNFSDKDEDVMINVDWKSLGIPANGARVTLPAVKDFQDARNIDLSKPLTVPAKKGFLILISK